MSFLVRTARFVKAWLLTIRVLINRLFPPRRSNNVPSFGVEANRRSALESAFKEKSTDSFSADDTDYDLLGEEIPPTPPQSAMPPPAPLAASAPAAPPIPGPAPSPKPTMPGGAPPAPSASLSFVEPSPESQNVFFTAYYAREIQAQHRYGLYVYAHLEAALDQIARDVQKFQPELGDKIPAPKTAKQSTNLKIGTPITVTPICDDDALTFDPPSLTKKWDVDWTRFDFDCKPPLTLIGDTVTGRIAITVYGIEVAQIKFAFEVIAAPVSDPKSTPQVADRLDNPLASAKFASTSPVSTYQHIFVSYSRKDSVVAEVYWLAQRALGNEVFMDTYSIRVGEGWEKALALAIDRADIFQLFWSANAAASENVRHEWDYALRYRCADSDCATFIRPVYWINPLPAPPPELARLNFKYVPLADVPASPDQQAQA